MSSDALPRIPLIKHDTHGLESLDSTIDRRSQVYRQRTLLEHPERVIQPPATIPPSRRRKTILTLPNILTMSRLIMVPVFMYYFQNASLSSAPIAALVFICASLTDWLDGYLARRLQLVSAFGAFLDPVADKVMVSTALILLTTSPPSGVSMQEMTIPVVLIIGREICMSALREWAATSGTGAHAAVKVNSLGKWKTFMQMVAMSVLLCLRSASTCSERYLALPVATTPASHLARALVSFLLRGCRPATPLPSKALKQLASIVAAGSMSIEKLFVLVTNIAMGGLWIAAALAVWSFGIYLANAWEHFFTEITEQAKKTS